MFVYCFICWGIMLGGLIAETDIDNEKFGWVEALGVLAAPFLLPLLVGNYAVEWMHKDDNKFVTSTTICDPYLMSSDNITWTCAGDGECCGGHTDSSES